MWVFYILLVIPLAIQHIKIKGYSVEYQKKNEFALFFFFALLTMLVALRHEGIGNDTRNYIKFFNAYKNVSWAEIERNNVELGFSYYNKFISLLAPVPQLFLSVTVFLTTAMIYPTYRRLGVDASLTIMIFCVMSTFEMMFSGIRQMLAVGIGFIAYECTRRKKLIPFLLCILMAILFHTSAFMLIFMYPLYHAKITQKWLFVIIPALTVIFAFNGPIFTVLRIIIERYTEYNAEIERTGAYTMLLLFIVFTVFAFLIPEESKLDVETVGLRNLLLLSVVIQMFAPLHTLAMRMNYYYIIFIPLLIPKIIQCRSTRWNQVAVTGRHIMVVFFLAYFFISASGGGGLHIFPYHFYWENI